MFIFLVLKTSQAQIKKCDLQTIHFYFFLFFFLKQRKSTFLVIPILELKKFSFSLMSWDQITVNIKQSKEKRDILTQKSKIPRQLRLLGQSKLGHCMGWWIYIFSPQYSHLDGRIRGHPFGTPPPALLPEPLSSWTRHRARDLPVAHVKRKLASSSKRCNQKVKLWFIPSWIMAPWLNYPSEHIHKFTARSLGWDVPDVFIAQATSDYRVRVSPGGCAL